MYGIMSVSSVFKTWFECQLKVNGLLLICIHFNSKSILERNIITTPIASVIGYHSLC